MQSSPPYPTADSPDARDATDDPRLDLPDTTSRVYVDAWDEHVVRSTSRTTRRRWGRVVRESAATAAFAILLFVGTQTVVQGREVHGPSMLPTYHEGQRLFITRYFFRDPHHGDVVVFKPPVGGPDQYIKRIIGVPGDRVSIRNGRVRINGEALGESYLDSAQTSCSGRWCELTLGADEFYVMGDNRTNSSDSRYWGPVQRASLTGKAWLLYYPFSEAGWAP